MSRLMTSNYNGYATSGFAHFSGSSTSGTNLLTHFLRGIPLPLNEINLTVAEDAKYSIFEVANWFLFKESMTHKKLQKLCYYAQAWFYALKDIRLTDTVFEAWIHGPVSPVLYEKFKSFGFSAIKLVGDYSSSITQDELELLESVWETYGDRTGNALEALSHSEQPWIDARVGYREDERSDVVITPESMKKYYQSIYIGGDA